MKIPCAKHEGYAVLTRLSAGYSPLLGKFLRVTQPFATACSACRAQCKAQSTKKNIFLCTMYSVLCAACKARRPTCMPKARR
jgi:hypothetical protein